MRIERSPLCQQQQPVGCMILVVAHRGAGEAIDTHQATPYHIKPHHTIPNHTIPHNTIPYQTGAVVEEAIDTQRARGARIGLLQRAGLAAIPELCLAKEIEIAMSLLQTERLIKIQFLKKEDADKMSHFSF